MVENLRSIMLKGSYVILFMIMSVIITGCDNNNNAGSLRAVLSVQESPNVPGRIELDPRGSKPGAGQKLVSFAVEVIDQETGETVFGPVTVSANTDSALLREYFPSGNYLAILTVTATPLTTDEVTAARGTEGQTTDTTEKMFSVDAIIAFPMVGSCEATCSGISTNPGQTVCTLPTDCFTLGLINDAMNQAKSINSSINENSTMWIQAYGASGGAGTDNSFGGDGGKAGAGGFAQTITTINEFDMQFDTTTIFYYLGEAGTHDDSGGSGGASTIMTSVEPLSSTPIALNDLVLIAGGGGGGGEGETVGPSGSNGGGGGFAYSTTEDESDVGEGDSVTNNNMGGKDFIGGGGTSCTEGIACGGSGANDGIQGFGGESGGSSDNPGPMGWINGTAELEDNAGQGGNASGGATCDGGGGGGGFGGGGAGVTITDGQCGGGAGGGSYAAASATTDTNAPSTNPDYSGDGEVIITFNTDPSIESAMSLPITGTNCTLFESASINGVQCVYTTSQDNTTNAPVNLNSFINEINSGLLALNTTLNVGTTIGIEAISGKAGKGGEFFTTSGGEPGNPGYAVTVQTLNNNGEIEITGFTGVDLTVPELFLYVGQNATTPSDKRGGNGGTASIVMGKEITDIPADAILLPTGGLDTMGQTVEDQLIFVIGGGPGGGSETNSVASDGADGGNAGSMGQMGPFTTTGDPTVAGETGSGGFTSSAGSEQGDGIGGRNGGNDFTNSGTDGIGGFGGGNDNWVESTLTSSDWPNGMGGARGGGGDTEPGGGGGGWGGGGGGGVNSTDGPFWTGGSGAGSFARQSVSKGSELPMLFNISGGSVSTESTNEQIILSFSIVSTGSP